MLLLPKMRMIKAVPKQNFILLREKNSTTLLPIDLMKSGNVEFISKNQYEESKTQ